MERRKASNRQAGKSVQQCIGNPPSPFHSTHSFAADLLSPALQNFKSAVWIDATAAAADQADAASAAITIQSSSPSLDLILASLSPLVTRSPANVASSCH